MEIDKAIQSSRDNKEILINRINLNTNQGYGGGIVAGLQERGNYIGWAHADLQTPLIDFYKLFKIINGKK